MEGGLNMDIALGLEALGYSDEEISPYSDGSSYQAMVETWRHSTKSPPSASALQAASDAAIKSIAYIHKREEEYFSVVEQLDMIYHDKMNGTNLWMQHRENVKSNNPKPI